MLVWDYYFEKEQIKKYTFSKLKQMFLKYPSLEADFEKRFQNHFSDFFDNLYKLYGDRLDFIYIVEKSILQAGQSYINRDADLKKLDKKREKNPDWFANNNVVGAVLYVDLFCDNLSSLKSKLSYFKDLGITYLHLMPILDMPKGENDGGYAVSDYRKVAPNIGTMAQLKDICAYYRENGISIVLDFVCNHTSDEHEWAEKAKAGDAYYQRFYFMYDDRCIPDQFEPNLREIFPDRGEKAFIWRKDVKGKNGGKWVWSTFNTYQWDLNYSNPEVFCVMTDEILFLANQGIEILRLDAVPFIWKKLGTSCENQQEVHYIIRAMNALMRMAAPTLIFKSEAIVHPDIVRSYIDAKESQLSYNPNLMCLLWEALATRETKLISHSCQKRMNLPYGSDWVNYIRCHDDIGVGFANEDAWEVGIDAHGHRSFVANYYIGRFKGSFASGLPFQENLSNGDVRISGTLASLAGLENALIHDNKTEIELAITRILMMHAIILTIGGVPLIYIGDEIAQLNDYDFIEDRAKQHDNRWVHRPKMNWDLVNKIENHQEKTPYEYAASEINTQLKKLIKLRKNHHIFSVENQLDVFDCNNEHVFAYKRKYNSDSFHFVANFSENEQKISLKVVYDEYLKDTLFDSIAQKDVKLNNKQEFVLKPYQILCFIEEVSA